MEYWITAVVSLLLSIFLIHTSSAFLYGRPNCDTCHQHDTQCLSRCVSKEEFAKNDFDKRIFFRPQNRFGRASQELDDDAPTKGYGNTHFNNNNVALLKRVSSRLRFGRGYPNSRHSSDAFRPQTRFGKRNGFESNGPSKMENYEPVNEGKRFNPQGRFGKRFNIVSYDTSYETSYPNRGKHLLKMPYSDFEAFLGGLNCWFIVDSILYMRYLDLPSLMAGTFHKPQSICRDPWRILAQVMFEPAPS